MHHLTKNRRAVLALLLALMLPLVLAACGLDTNDSRKSSVLEPAGPVADRTNNLWWLMFWIMLAIEALVVILVITALVKFRRRPNEGDPVQVTGNTRLEIAWTIAPAVILAVLLVVTLNTMITTQEPPGQKLTINAAGHLWWWELNYEGLGVVTGNELHIPVNEDVRINLSSDNVLHGFWVPNLGGKRQVVPGHDNNLWFRGTEVGTFAGKCTEFCGAQHANMNFWVVVEPRPQFDAWVQRQRADAAPVITADMNAEQRMLIDQGSQVILKQACAGCHVIRGLPNYQVGKVGPDLTHFGGRAYLAAGTLPNTPENLARWLRNPQEVKPGNKMPNLNLDEITIRQLVAYLESLK